MTTKFGAPDHRDEHGEGDVAGRHPPILADATVKHRDRSDLSR